MISSTDIANSALTRLGAAHILDITDTATETGRVLNAEYPLARDKLLRTYRWAFAMKRVSLAADASPPDWGFDRQFELPADYLSLDMIGPDFVGLDMSDYRNSDSSDFSIEGRKILTNRSAPLPIRYTRQVTEAGLFDPCFAELLTIQLAFACCERVTGAITKKESLRGDRKQSVIDALRANAIERPPSPVADDTWMIGRL
jgi:hypothetical protein